MIYGKTHGPFDFSCDPYRLAATWVDYGDPN